MTDRYNGNAAGADRDPKAPPDIMPSPAPDALALESQSFQCISHELSCFNPHSRSVIQHPRNGCRRNSCGFCDFGDHPELPEFNTIEKLLNVMYVNNLHENH
jgi:hypothetical protein